MRTTSSLKPRGMTSDSISVTKPSFYFSSPCFLCIEPLAYARGDVRAALFSPSKDDKTVRFNFKKTRGSTGQKWSRGWARLRRLFGAAAAGDLHELHIYGAAKQRRDGDSVEDAVDEICDACPDRLQTAAVVMHADILIAGELRADLLFRRYAAERAHHLAQRNFAAGARQTVAALRPAHALDDPAVAQRP